MFPAVVACLMVSPVAAVRTDELRRENARLEREINELRLDAMEFRYRSGRDLPVANMGERAPVEQSTFEDDL